MSDPNPGPLSITILIPALNEAGNIGELVGRCRATLAKLGETHEIVVVDGGSKDGTVAEAEGAGARVIQQTSPGYGGALAAGFAAARGERVITMDSDLSHEPEVIEQLWAARDRGDVVIASRYVAGGGADMSVFRGVLSRILNVVFTTLLSVPVKDISSGFRLYRRESLAAIRFDARDFDVLEEILIRILVRGGAVAEIPFHYRPRKEGKSHAKLFKFGVAYLKTLGKMWRLRRGGTPAAPNKPPYTPGLREVFKLAKAEAGRLGVTEIGPEHFLLAMIRKVDGLGLEALQNLRVDLEKLRAETERLAEIGKGPTCGSFPISADAEQARSLACQIAHAMNHGWVGTEHLLIALSEQKGTIAQRALAQAGVTPKSARAEARNVIEGRPGNTAQ